MQMLQCGNCRALNVVETCSECGRGFVVTKARIEGRTREPGDEDGALAEFPDNIVQPCDFCLSKQNNESGALAVGRGLLQRTCGTCRHEFLTAHGFEK